MTERPTGRHRATHKPSSSSLATLTGPLSVVGDRAGLVRRSGVIIAMSSGLVASMALPAGAVASAPAGLSGPQTASMPAVDANGSTAFFAAPEGGLLALPPGLALEDGIVAASADSTLDFDRTAFVPTATSLTGDAAVSGTGQDQQDDTQQDAGDGARQQAPASRREARQAAAEKAAAIEKAAAAKVAAVKAAAARTAAAKAVAAKARAAAAKTSSSSSPAASDSEDDGDSGSAVASSGLGASAVTLASRYLGTPYRYGGSTPGGFDCSGLIQYVYGKLGKKLPRTAAQQASAVQRIPRSQARPGDLVLFPGGGHIGLYMGNGMMLDAPHTGTVVQIRKIYSANVSFGRVG